jgi:hypothetical protein
MILMRANPLLRPLEWMGPEYLDFLKVDSNEKEGDQEGDSNFSFCLALWQSRVICNMNVL